MSPGLSTTTVIWPCHPLVCPAGLQWRTATWARVGTFICRKRPCPQRCHDSLFRAGAGQTNR